MTNEPKTTAERDYPPLPEPAFKLRWDGSRARYTVSKPNIGDTDVFTEVEMHAYYDLGRDKVKAWMRLADQRAIEVAELKVELRRLRALAASPTAQAAPAAVAVPRPDVRIESALAELVDKILPGIDSGDLLADALAASERLSAMAQPPAEAQEPAAWIHEDDPDRCISAAQKAAAMRDGGASASSVRPYSIPAYTHPAPQQAVPTSERVREEKALRERDEAEEFIDALLDEVLGTDRPEWSSAYGRAEALQDVQERITALHAPSVDRAWGRFQSAAASGAPVQHVAYLDLGAGGYMDVGTDLSDDQLAALPKGRHMLAIVGTYGVDGFVPVAPTSEQAGAPPVLCVSSKEFARMKAGDDYIRAWLPPATGAEDMLLYVTPASGGAAPVANIAPSDMVEVCREDANNYCRILRVLGMEEEGDAVAEVKRLHAAQATPGLSEQDAGLLEQGASMLEALSGDERNRGNDSAAMGADCSAHAVRRLAAKLLAAPVAEGDAWAELTRLADCCPELNERNYDQGDVEELNAWAVEVAQIVNAARAQAAKEGGSNA